MSPRELELADENGHARAAGTGTGRTNEGRHGLGLAGLMLGTLGLAIGCATTPVEEHWGEAYRRAALIQTVEPDAGARGSGPEGLDPRTAELVTETYERNQRKERSDPEEIFLLRQ